MALKNKNRFVLVIVILLIAVAFFIWAGWDYFAQIEKGLSQQGSTIEVKTVNLGQGREGVINTLSAWQKCGNWPLTPQLLSVQRGNPFLMRVINNPGSQNVISCQAAVEALNR